METPTKPEHHLARMHREKREAAERLASGEAIVETPVTENTKSEKVAEPEVLTKPKVEEPAIDINKLIADAVAKALASQPSAQPQAVQQVYTSKKDYDIDDDIPEIANWELKSREYRLMNGKRPITHSIRRAHSLQMAMQYFNKRTGKTHTMRWSPNQTSFFIEKQSTNAADILDEEIVFSFGTLNVPENNPNLQKFLHIHPLKGILFEEYNANDESRKVVNTKKIKAKAYSLIESVGKSVNRAICSLVSPAYIEAWEYDQIEEAIYNYAETNPQDYINYCEDPNVKVKGVAKSALANGDISFKNYKFFDKNNVLIIETDRNKNELDEIVNHFNSNAGRNLYDYLLNLR